MPTVKNIGPDTYQVPLFGGLVMKPGDTFEASDEQVADLHGNPYLEVEGAAAPTTTPEPSVAVAETPAAPAATVAPEAAPTVSTTEETVAVPEGSHVVIVPDTNPPAAI